MKRRTLLRGAALASLPLAGCLGDAPATETDTQTPSPSPTPSPTPRPPELTNADFEVTDAGCGQQTERTSVTFHGSAVSVDGTTSAPNGCYEAFFEGANYNSARDELTVAVQTRSHTAASCVQCIYEFEYDVACQFEHGLPGTVVVTHDGTVVARVEQ